MSDKVTPSHWLIVEPDVDGKNSYRFRCAHDDEHGERLPRKERAVCDDSIIPGCKWCHELNRVITLADDQRSAVLFAMRGKRLFKLVSGKVEFGNDPDHNYYAGSSRYVWRYFERQKRKR